MAFINLKESKLLEFTQDELGVKLKIRVGNKLNKKDYRTIYLDIVNYFQLNSIIKITPEIHDYIRSRYIWDYNHYEFLTEFKNLNGTI